MINPEGGARPPNFGGAGAMPGPGGQPRPDIDPAKAPDNSFDPAGYGVWIIHAHDDTAQPGKTYRYRIDYKMKNPLFNVAAAAKNDEDTKVFMIQPKLTKADIEAQWTEPVTIPPGERRFVKTGLALAIPDGFEGQVRPRSGLALRHGIGIVNSPGTIDSDYRGEIGIVLVNHGNEPFLVEPLARIAQLVIAPVARAELTLVASLDETERGAGGYGSTGV